MRAASGAGSREDVPMPIGIQGIAHPYASVEVGTVGHETLQKRIIHSAKDLHLRPASGSRTPDDVRLPVPVHIACGHIDSPRKVGTVSHELPDDVAMGGGQVQMRSIEDPDIRTASRTWS